MDKFPRSVGNPRQHIVTKPRQFLRWVERTNGRATCYTSHNSYPQLTKDGDPKEVKVRNLFLDFDMDSEDAIPFKKVARDVQLVTDYLSDKNIQHSVAFSGRAGYHIHIHMKPSTLPLNNGLSLKYRSIYAHLRTELNLMSLDQRCAEPKRLCRIPGTIYSKEGKVTERKCYPIPKGVDIPNSQEEMYEKSKKEIPEGSFVREGDKYEVQELMDMWDIEEKKMNDDELYTFNEYKPPNTNFLKLAGEFFRPCIRSALFTSNPPHFVRMTACTKMKIIFPQQKTISFFDRLASEANWIDGHNKKVRDYNIKQIYRKNYNLPKCPRIKEEGYCVGEECRYYKGNGSDEDED